MGGFGWGVFEKDFSTGFRSTKAGFIIGKQRDFGVFVFRRSEAFRRLRKNSCLRRNDVTPAEAGVRR